MDSLSAMSEPRIDKRCSFVTVHIWCNVEEDLLQCYYQCRWLYKKILDIKI